jgi:hypothetical protein
VRRAGFRLELRNVNVLGMDKIDLRSGARRALGFHPGTLRGTAGMLGGPAAARRCAAGQGGGVAWGATIRHARVLPATHHAQYRQLVLPESPNRTL